MICSNLPDSECQISSRITPSWIRNMGENEIFVFGSNVNGYHGGGAARFATNTTLVQYGETEKVYKVPHTPFRRWKDLIICKVADRISSKPLHIKHKEK